MYQEPLDSSVTCTYGLKLKKMSAKETFYLQIKEYLWKFLSDFYLRCINHQNNIFMKYSSSFSSFKTLPTSLRVFF